MLAAGSALAFVGCSTSSTSSAAASTSSSGAASSASSAATTSEASSSTGAGKSIIVLWSWSDNTLKMAERVSGLSDAEIYRIEAAEPYSANYDETADRAKREQDDGVYPKISNPIANWDDYDTVFLGYPIWWYQLPMIVQGFVNDHGRGHKFKSCNAHQPLRAVKRDGLFSYADLYHLSRPGHRQNTKAGNNE